MSQVAAIMTDLTGAEGTVPRFGGKEFAIVMAGAEKAAAAAVAEAIRVAVEKARDAKRLSFAQTWRTVAIRANARAANAARV